MKFLARRRVFTFTVSMLGLIVYMFNAQNNVGLIAITIALLTALFEVVISALKRPIQSLNSAVGLFAFELVVLGTLLYWYISNGVADESQLIVVLIFGVQLVGTVISLTRVLLQRSRSNS